jgi:transcriptional regulator with XRE-family HTH domain
MNHPIPLPVERAIKKLGADLSLARRRRQLSQAMLAERIGTSLMTVRRMEEGSASISLQHVARALHVFGELDRLADLIDSSRDGIGLALMDEQVPRRVRAPRRDKDSGAL